MNNLPRAGSGKSNPARGLRHSAAPATASSGMKLDDAEAMAGLISIRPPPPSQLPPARRSRRREANTSTAAAPLVVKRASGGAAVTDDLTQSRSRFDLYKEQKLRGGGQGLPSSSSGGGARSGSSGGVASGNSGQGQRDLMRSQPIRSAAAMAALTTGRSQNPMKGVAGAAGLVVSTDQCGASVNQKSGRLRSGFPHPGSISSGSSAQRSNSASTQPSLGSRENSRGSHVSAELTPLGSRANSRDTGPPQLK